MRYKFITIALLMCSIFSASAYDKKQMNDTLTAIVAQYAQVGRISITKAKETEGKWQLTANEALTWAPISQGLIDSLCGAAAKVIGTDSVQNISIVIEKPTRKSGQPDCRIKMERPLSDFITTLRMSPEDAAKKQHMVLPTVAALTQNTSRPYTAPLGLEGCHIALYGSHGLYYNQGQDRWVWQRARLFTTVEDLYTTSYTMPFLVPMLENAGAVVIQARERDRQTHEVIVDETEATGEAWERTENGGWGPIPDDMLFEGENPFTFGGYISTKATANAGSVRYTPAIPEAGEYAVYVSYKSLKNSTTHADYTVMHNGIETHFSVNQTMAGGTWVYLGTFAFTGDKERNYVAISGKGKKGEVVSSDAVRFGGGYGNVARYPQKNNVPNVPSAQENGSQKAGTALRNYPARKKVGDIAQTSGVPRWIEGSRYWFQYSGIPDSVYAYTGGKNDYTDDYASRGRWMNWLAGGSAVYPDSAGLKIPVEMGLAFHTDAGDTKDSSIVGTLLIYTDWDDDKQLTYPGGGDRSLARDYADYMQTQLVNDVRATFAPEWNRRRLHNSSYAESRNPKLPVVLLEFLSHQNFADMKYGLDPSFRFVVSRAIYKSMLRFNHEQYGTPYIVQPLPVTDFAIRFTNGDSIRLSWTGREDQLEPTATPKQYVLYTRIAGSDWDNGVLVDSTFATCVLPKDTICEFKVCALNEGGISFPSEILSACKKSNEKGKVLVINGFNLVSGPDRIESKDGTVAGFIPCHYGVGYMNEVAYIGDQYAFDRSQPWVSDDHSGFGSCWNDMRDITPVGNTFDYPTKHGQELAKMNYSFVSTSVSAVNTIEEGYSFVDIIMGKQKAITIGNNPTPKYEVFPANIRSALETYKGNLILSGAYIGTDMQDKADQDWTKRVLHYSFRSDNASHTGKINIQRTLPKSVIQLVTTVNETILPCENPGGIAPAEGAAVMARYVDSSVSAAVSYNKDGRRMLIFAFPLESVENFEQIYSSSVKWIDK